MHNNRISRRKFISHFTSLGLATLGIGRYRALRAFGGDTRPIKARRSKVVLVKDEHVVKDEKVNSLRVEKMLRKGILTLTGASSVQAAWKQFFKPEDIVGLKINSEHGPGAATHPEVTEAVVRGIQLAGVTPENIIGYDMYNRFLLRAGYRLNREGPGVKYYGTEDDYEPEPTPQGSFNGRLSKILTRKITALVNLPILKDHYIAGITASMKNHYGSFHNPSAHHANNCDPYIADLNAVPAIRNKTRLIICDVLRPTANGGPVFSPNHIWDYCGLLLSTDPVALDYICWQIIEERRRQMGLPSLEAAGRKPRWIESAARLGLGTNDPKQIELIEVKA